MFSLWDRWHCVHCATSVPKPVPTALPASLCVPLDSFKVIHKRNTAAAFTVNRIPSEGLTLEESPSAHPPSVRQCFLNTGRWPLETLSFLRLGGSRRKARGSWDDWNDLERKAELLAAAELGVAR
jgi:hypothetical protein